MCRRSKTMRSSTMAVPVVIAPNHGREKWQSMPVTTQIMSKDNTIHFLAKTTNATVCWRN
jgi:hypothetical protein